MTQTAGTILILVMLAIMAARAVPLIRTRVMGEVLLEMPVPIFFRLLSQRTNVLCILAVLVLGSGLVGERWISPGLFLLTLVAMGGIVSFPARYQFTSSGVSPNRATFRPWSDFVGWQASGNVVFLQAAGRFGSLKLYVPSQEREDVLQVVKRFLKSSARPTARQRGAKKT